MRSVIVITDNRDSPQTDKNGVNTPIDKSHIDFRSSGFKCIFLSMKKLRLILWNFPRINSIVSKMTNLLQNLTVELLIWNQEYRF